METPQQIIITIKSWLYLFTEKFKEFKTALFEVFMIESLQ